MPPIPPVTTNVPSRPQKLVFRCGRKCFKCALNDPLAADIDPAACRHLAIHRQTIEIEPTEFSRVAQCGTRLAFAISIRGAYESVRKIATGLPD